MSMNRWKYLHPKRLSFPAKRLRNSTDFSTSDKSLVLLDEEASSPSNTFDEKDSTDPGQKHSILKFRSAVTLNDPDLLSKFGELFQKDSSETLLKRYRCSSGTQSALSFGKLYVTSNFLCFVESKRKTLQVVIRMEDVERWETDYTSVEIHVYNQVHTFSDFNVDSGVAFISNYLRLTVKPNSVATSGPSPQSSFSSLPPRRSLTPPASPAPDGKAYAAECLVPARQSTFSAVDVAFESIFGGQGLSAVYEVAYQASCIPLLILIRVLSFVASLATSSLQAAPFNFQPPRAFKNSVVYFVFLFLAASIAYLYYRLEQIPLSSSVRTTGTQDDKSAQADCRSEFQNLANSIQSLSQNLQRLEDKLTPGLLKTPSKLREHPT